MRENTKRMILGALLFGAVALGLVHVACTSKTIGNALGTEADQVRLLRTAAPAGASGAELWQNNCQRCHNFRDPGSLSDAQWDVVVHHMRVRANLTAEEHRLIAEFLKSAN